MTDDVKTLFPERIVTLSGTEFTIKPFKVGQLMTISKMLKNLLQPIQDAKEAGKLGDTSTILSLISDGGPDLLELIGFAIGKPVKFVENLEQDEFIELVAAFIAINQNFFKTKTLPAFKKAQSEFTVGPTES